jgi:hypothetical protein
LQLKLQHFVLPRSENFGIWPTNATQIDCILFCRAAKTLQFANKSNSNWLYFGLPRSQNFWNLPTQGCILFCRAGKFFGICEPKQLKLTDLFWPRSENVWNLPTPKQLKLTALDERESA